jgi:glycosyltransferase involved in cell wall biosynthesis
MRIALIVPGPLTGTTGGNTYDRHIAAGMRAAGHTVEIVELAGYHKLADETARGAASAAWTSLHPAALPVIDGLALPAFAAQAEAFATRRVAALIHHPTALRSGHSEEQRASVRAAEHLLMPLLARVVATSTPTAERLAADFGVAPGRIAVVLPGTAAAPRAPGSGTAGSAILSVGALVPRKGHDVLLRTLARLFDLDWRLTIVGSPARDPVHARALRELADTLRIAHRVTFVPDADDAALDALWQTADIFALATQWEGYGMTIAEALKRGLPVAVCSGGAAADLVTPDTGIVCHPGDEVQLSKALRRLIFDTALRGEMADAAWAAGQKLPDWTTQARAFADALAGHA